MNALFFLNETSRSILLLLPNGVKSSNLSDCLERALLSECSLSLLSRAPLASGAPGWSASFVSSTDASPGNRPMNYDVADYFYPRPLTSGLLLYFIGLIGASAFELSKCSF
jgi:hypothetical protein